MGSLEQITCFESSFFPLHGDTMYPEIDVSIDKPVIHLLHGRLVQCKGGGCEQLVLSRNLCQAILLLKLYSYDKYPYTGIIFL